MTRRSATIPRPGRVLLNLATLLLVAVAATAEDLYTAALTHERELRAPADEPPTLAQLRGAIAAYKAIVQQYPRSGYSDNALWQSAGLAIQAFDLYRQPADRDAGVGFLRALEREYPSSSFVPRVADRLGQLTRLDRPVQIRAIDRERLTDIVRVTIALDDEVRYDVVRLDGPARLFFDFRATYAAPPLDNATLAFDDGDIVREIRLGRHPGQTTRVVLDIEDVDTYSVYSLYNPYRLVVDAVPTAAMQARRAIPEAPPLVAARRESPAAFDRRYIPAAGVAARSNTTGMLPRHAVDWPDAASPRTGLGATPDLHDGLPAVAGDIGPPPTDPSDAPSPVDPHATDEAPSPESPPLLLSVPEGWEARRLDPIAPALEPAAADLVDTERATSTNEPDPASQAASAPDLTPPSATSGDTMPEADELAWPQVHDVLYPNLGLPPSLETGGEVQPIAQTEPVAETQPAAETEPTAELGFVTPRRTREAVAPATPVFPESIVDVLPFPRVEPAVQIVHQAPAPAEPAVTDVVVESLGQPEGRPGPETALANADGDFSLGRQLGLGVSRIVIDPGHGGYDPGAQTGALTESALVLDVARRLEARLTTEAGIEVILTRRRDAYVPLRARTELANRVGADLFLSIHANAAGDRRARGVETYYLALASDPTAQAVAARENATFREGMHHLPQLIRSITMHNKLDESRDFAAMVQRNLIGAVRELHPDAQDLGVKQAPFVVLIGANMPSVLAEISFLTNQEDASYLATDAYRDHIADALLRSILEYQQTLKPSPSFAVGNNE